MKSTACKTTIPQPILNELCHKKVCGVMATVLSSDGHGPARLGDSLFWSEGKLIFGTVGGGNNEQQVLEACANLKTKKLVLEISSFLPGTLPSCGGKLKIQLHKVDFGNPEEAAFWKNELALNHRGNLFLMGAGHVAREVAWLADRNGFEIIIIDPRKELMQAEYFPESCTLCLQNHEQFFSETAPGDKDFIIIAGPDHPTDLAALQKAALTSAHYIGVMGSRKKIGSFEKVLKKTDLWQALEGRLYAPIGIPISSRSPAEVAVSIVAELIQTRAS